MLVQVLGVANIDFTTKEGQAVKGTSLYVAYEAEGVEGLKADRFFVRDGVAIPKEMKINDMLEVDFNNRGKLEGIKLAN